MIFGRYIFLRVFSIFILIFFELHYCNANGEVLEMFKIENEVSSTLTRMWEMFQMEKADLTMGTFIENYKNVMNMIKGIEDTENLQKWALSFRETSFLTNDIWMESKFLELNNAINSISLRFQNIQNMLNSTEEQIETQILHNDYKTISNPSSIYYEIVNLNIILKGDSDFQRSSKIFHKIFTNNLKNDEKQSCISKKSAQLILLRLYKNIHLTYLKGYALSYFSWNILRRQNQGNFSEEAKAVDKNFREQSKQLRDLFYENLQSVDRQIRRCDPDNHVSGKTYEQITRLIQYDIKNEADLNADGSCTENCEYYSSAKSYSCFEDNNNCNMYPQCEGHLYNCQSTESTYQLYYRNGDNLRRYSYIKKDDGTIFGKERYSHSESTVKSWTRWFVRCSYCMCLCDEPGPYSDRYFNLREVTSNIRENMVVTGVRFKKEQRVIHLQIQEGKLGKYGIIEENSIRWKPLDSYSIHQRDVKENSDYYEMSYYKRSIDFIDIFGNGTDTIVGVAFYKVGDHLSLKVKFMKFNFETGKLYGQIKDIFPSYSNSQQIYLSRPDIPSLHTTETIVMSKKQQYINFQHTDLYKDAGQTTVPFIDIQEVVSEPQVPLSGIGIYYKGTSSYAGFIAPRIYTYDYTPHISTL